jgi:methyl-accepting chemotaxis protein
MYEMELMGLSYIKEANINLIYIGRARANAQLAVTEADRAKQVDMASKALATMKDYMEKARPLFVSDRGKQLFANYSRDVEDYARANAAVFQLISARELQKRDEAMAQAMGSVSTLAHSLDDLMSELTEQKEARAKQASNDTTVLYESSRTLMISTIIVSVLSGIALGWFISRSITRPVIQAVDVAGQLAAGDLAVKVEVKSGDETGQLLQAMQSMAEKLGQVVDGQKVVVAAANRGDFSARVDLDGLRGFQKELGDGLNQQMATTGEAIGDVVRVMGAVSEGDLGKTIIKSYEGAFDELKQYANNTVTKLNQVISGQKQAVAAANRGDFAVRIDTAGLQGFQKELADGLNQLMITTGASVADVVRVMGAVSEGDLSKTIDKPYEGAFDQLKTYTNSTIGKLNLVIDDVGRVMGAVSEGDLSQTIVRQYEGAYGNLKNHANNTVGKLNLVIEGQRRVVEAANHGDFTCRVDLSGLKGFQKELGDGMNQLMATTGASIDDVVRVMGALAEGDLNKTIDKHYEGSFGELKSYANNTVAKLLQVVTDVNQGAQALASASEEVSATAQALSQASSEQAASVEETSASLEQMTSSISQNTENAKVTDSMATKGARR